MHYASSKVRRSPEAQRALKANLDLYDATGTRGYRNTAPHVKHGEVRRFHQSLIEEIYMVAAQNSAPVTVLDLGAGEGSSSFEFLRLGAHVTAVDLSRHQLEQLQLRCREYSARLQVRNEDAWQTLQRPARYDVVVANSFLHHIPDYLTLISDLVASLGPGGQFLSFQDPLRYDSLGWATHAFSQSCYFAWRIFQGHLWRGLQTRIRRARGIYIAGSKEDDGEYHVTRNGVDQDAICQLLQAKGFDCELIRYFSTQSALLQRLGSWLELPNTFAVRALRRR